MCRYPGLYAHVYVGVKEVYDVYIAFLEVARGCTRSHQVYAETCLPTYTCVV